MPDINQLLQDLTNRTQGNYDTQVQNERQQHVGNTIMGIGSLLKDAEKSRIEKEKALQEVDLHKQQAGYYKAHADELMRLQQPPTPDEENMLNQLYKANTPSAPGSLPPPDFKFGSRESANKFYELLKNKITQQGGIERARIVSDSHKAADTMSPEMISWVSEISGKSPEMVGQMSQKELRLAMTTKRTFEGVPNPGRDAQQLKVNADKAEANISKAFDIIKFPSMALEEAHSAFEDIMSNRQDPKELEKIDLSKLNTQEKLAFKIASNRYKHKHKLLLQADAGSGGTEKSGSIYEGLK